MERLNPLIRVPFTQTPHTESAYNRAMARATDARPRRRVSIVGVFGELLITAGVLVGFFVLWQQFLDDWISGGQIAQQAVALSQAWNQGSSDDPADTTTDAGVPYLTSEPAADQDFATLVIPRFGADYYRIIRQGTGLEDVLDQYRVGHYPGTQMPGQVGNFAVAAHRTTFGGGFHDLNKLQVGDDIWVGTKQGWYEYSFRNLEYVQPTQVSVIAPVPNDPGATPSERYMTMTSCNPFFSAAERIIAYADFVKFYPRADGPPPQIADTVKGA